MTDKSLTTYLEKAKIIEKVTKINVACYHDDEKLFEIGELSLPNFILNPKLFFNIPLQNPIQSEYLQVETPFSLEYLVFPTKIEFKDNLFFAIGPFTSQSLNPNQVKHVLALNSLSINELTTLEAFYHTVPLLSESEITVLATLTVTLLHNPLITTVKKSNNTIKRKVDIPLSIVSNKEKITQNYSHQKKIMNAIKEGNEAAITELTSNLNINLHFFEDRVPNNPLRSTKNIALVLNTTCRIAAEEGGVHPFYLHQISEKYALLIERIHSLTDLYLLMKNMAIEYTQLVNTYSVREFSPIIGRSIQYIQLHLGTPFSLKQIAENLSMNPSYLSRLFKEETGISLTEYINQQRIRAAKNYLQLDTTTITEVAFMVGYNDVNYFIKRFKKIVGLTPTQYRMNFQTH